MRWVRWCSGLSGRTGATDESAPKSNLLGIAACPDRIDARQCGERAEAAWSGDDRLGVVSVLVKKLFGGMKDSAISPREIVMTGILAGPYLCPICICSAGRFLIVAAAAQVSC